MLKYLNKNRLTSLKLCVSSFLRGFRVDLWPFNRCYWNRFALFIVFIILSQGWVPERSSRTDPLKENSCKFALKVPVASFPVFLRGGAAVHRLVHIPPISQKIVLFSIRDICSRSICAFADDHISSLGHLWYKKFKSCSHGSKTISPTFQLVNKPS